MAKAKRYGSDGAERGAVELPSALFEAPVSEHLIWEAVKSQLGNRRLGTHSTQNKRMMKGGGRKPWRQKGTGRARAGSNISPLWPGGAVAFGPKPRDYTTRTNAKARRKALCGALTVRAREGEVVVVEPPALDGPKTKAMSEYLQRIGLGGKKVLWVTDRAVAAQQKSLRNLARVETAESRTLNTYELMSCDCLVLTEGGLKSLTERLSA
ncbi:MAG TPA: 50S ribosomal protein L4 [Candidatus Eisenbacteria bacterium]|jgi:large subunit ribosomal protein L4